MINPEHIEPLACACVEDAPNTAIDRWKALCLPRLLVQLLRNGRDITLIVGRRTERKRGDFHVVRSDERN